MVGRLYGYIVNMGKPKNTIAISKKVLIIAKAILFCYIVLLLHNNSKSQQPYQKRSEQ